MPLDSTASQTAFRRGLVIVVLSALTGFAPMSIDMYLPGLPALGRDLGASPSGVQLTLSAFFLGFGGGQLFYGPMADRFGRRAPLAFGLALFTLASAGCALAPNLEALLLCRFLQGVGGCAGPVLARAIVRDLYAGDRAARVLSLMVLIMGLAPLLAPLIGGQILLVASWRVIFWVLLAFGALCLAAIVFLLDETLPAERRAHLSAVDMIRGYGAPLRHARYLGYAVSGSFVYSGLFAYLTGSPFVFITLYGVKPEHYGFIFGMNVLGLLGGAAVNGRLVLRLGADRLLARGVVGSALSGAALAAVAATGWGGLPALLVPLFCFSVSLGFVGANGMAGCLGLFPERAGMASALAGTMQFLAGALSGGLVGLLENGTALPMAGVIAVAGIGGFLSQRLLAPVRA